MQARFSYIVLSICILIITAIAQTAATQTPIGSEFQINTATAGNQTYPRVAMNASGDFVTVWGSGTNHIFCQRFDTGGVAAGTEFRVNTDTLVTNQYPSVAIDSSGSFVVVWVEDSQEIYGRRFDATGSPVGADFQVNTYTTNQQSSPDVAMHSTGSFVVVWQSYLQPGDGDGLGVYAQRYDNSGVPAGSEFRVNTTTASHQATPSVAMDSTGNFAVVWMSYAQDGDDYGIYRRRYNASGTPVDSETRVNSYTAGGQTYPNIAMLPTGGHVVVWTSSAQDGSSEGAYAQLYDDSGAAIGSEISVNTTTTSGQQRPRAAFDPARGFTVVWESNLQDGSGWGIYAQRFLLDGTKTGSEYLVNTTVTNNQHRSDVAISPAHEVVVWQSDGQDGDLGGIYGQRFSSPASAGDLTITSFVSPAELTDATQPIDISVTIANAYEDVEDWFRTGVYVSEDDTITVTDRLVYIAGTSELAAGEDTTYSVSLTLPNDVPRGDVYLGAIVDDLDDVTEALESNNVASSAFSFQVPVIYSVKDVEGDEGGWVYLKWYASPLDAVSAGGLITEYSLWRTIDMYSAAASFSAAAEKDRSLRVQRTAAGIIFWELVGTHDGYHRDGYASAVPTLFDSTAVNTDYHYCQVIAHTSDPLVFYISGIDSARSVDNLAPAAPQGLAGVQTEADAMELTWLPNIEADLSHYHVYRGTDAGFTPEAGNRIGAPHEPELTDADWTWDGGYWYKVTALDIHGNESVVAVLGPGVVVGAEDTTPHRTFLAQNYPNPFNPSTTIAFGADKSTRVTLRIYDAGGRLVRTLIDSDYEAGRYEALWDGRDAAGLTASSGVYFCRLNVGDRTITKKMLLLK